MCVFQLNSILNNRVCIEACYENFFLINRGYTSQKYAACVFDIWLLNHFSLNRYETYMNDSDSILITVSFGLHLWEWEHKYENIKYKCCQKFFVKSLLEK
jgi:hypothetical protein